MRGKEPSTVLVLNRLRITPACAGKSATLPANLDIYKDHPRLCGEKVTNGCQSPLLTGSPPPVRGKVLLSAPASAFFGITPACAGKSLCNLPSARSSRDHPRLCGEKAECTECNIRTPGSPPPVRGKAIFLAFLQIRDRITPACAGKSLPLGS